MGISDPMFIGDLQRRIAALEAWQRTATSGRRLESASIGAGGTRYHSGGSATFEGGGGVYIKDGGTQFVQGGKITAADPEGQLVFEVDAGEDPSIYMREELIRELAVRIFADRISSAFDSAAVQRNSTSFGDPTNGADPGPSVTGVDIQTGTALLFVSCNIALSTEDTTAANTGEYGGIVGVQVSGATSIAPDINRGVLAQTWKYNNSTGITTADGITGSITGTLVYPLTGLNPGEHTFTLKYRKSDISSSGILCDDRSLTVIGF